MQNYSAVNRFPTRHRNFYDDRFVGDESVKFQGRHSSQSNLSVNYMRDGNVHSGDPIVQALPDRSVAAAPVMLSLKDLLSEHAVDNLQYRAEWIGPSYDGHYHNQYARDLKDITKDGKKPLKKEQMLLLMSLLPKYSLSPSWTWENLSSIFYSFTVTGVFYNYSYLDSNMLATQNLLSKRILLLIENICKTRPISEQINFESIVSTFISLAKITNFRKGLKTLPDTISTAISLYPIATHVLKEKSFSAGSLCSLVWAMARLVNRDIKMSPDVHESISAALTCVAQVLKSPYEQHPLDPQMFTNLMWSVGVFVKKDLVLISTDQGCVATIILNYINKILKSPEGSDYLTVRHMINALLGMTDLLEARAVPFEQIKETAGLLLSCTDRVFQTAKSNKVEERIYITKLMSFMQTLIHQPGWVELLEKSDAVNKLLFCIQNLDKSFCKVVKIVPRYVNNVFYMIETLIKRRLGEPKNILHTIGVLMPRIVEIANSSVYVHRFHHRDIPWVLFGISYMGRALLLKGVQSVFDPLLHQFDSATHFNKSERMILLRGLLMYSARLFLEEEPISHKLLEQRISEQFNALSPMRMDTEEDLITLIMTSRWQNFAYSNELNYTYNFTIEQGIFLRRLKAKLPKVPVDRQISLDSLPPVDFFLPDVRIVIDVTRPCHYINDQVNGAMILKHALFTKKGLDVYFVRTMELAEDHAVNDIANRILEKMARTGQVVP